MRYAEGQNDYPVVAMIEKLGRWLLLDNKNLSN